MAPELHAEGVKATFKIDVYSFGMVCWELIMHSSPYQGLSDYELIEFVLSGQRPKLPSIVDGELRRVIEQVSICTIFQVPALVDHRCQ